MTDNWSVQKRLNIGIARSLIDNFLGKFGVWGKNTKENIQNLCTIVYWICIKIVCTLAPGTITSFVTPDSAFGPSVFAQQGKRKENMEICANCQPQVFSKLILIRA